LVHLSSDALFDGEIHRPYNEDDPPSPVNDYGHAKAEAERLVAEINPQASIVRTSLIYGGKQPSKHEETILAVANGQKQFSFYSDEMRCPVLVSDLASALLALLAVKYRGVLNIAGSEAVSRYRFAQLVAQRYGYSDQCLQAALSPGAAGGRPRRCVLDSSRAEALLGIQLRGVQEAINESTP
jgi:dTDP-4-dehydrorhamnose reductase